MQPYRCVDVGATHVKPPGTSDDAMSAAIAPTKTKLASIRRGGSWLCPTELDRARVVDANERVRTLRWISLGAISVGVFAAVPWEGWTWPAFLLPVAITFVVVDLRIKRAQRPELLSVGAILVTIAVLAIVVATDGGSNSPALYLLILPSCMIAARFRPQVVVAGVILTVAVILVATFGVHATATANDPVPIITVLALLVSVVSIVWAIQAAELQHRDAAVLDPLTKLLNRASLMPRFREISQQARLTSRPVSLLMCDIDGFKEINDVYGHDRGDAVLRDVAYEMRKQLRSFELVYRLGGEEFLVVRAGVGRHRATDIAERLRASVEEMDTSGVHATMCVGISVASGEDVEFEKLYKAADMALYEAKRNGRNCVVLFEPGGEEADRRGSRTGALDASGEPATARPDAETHEGAARESLSSS
jgi:diguanylate cyclase (GGDEF)-like protein